MKHVITFEEEDLLQYIKDMLAMRGVAPAEDLKIECEQTQTGTVHLVKVTCKEGTELTHCPMCKHVLGEVKDKEPEKPAVVRLVEPQVEQEPEEPEEPEEPVILDEELGESLEPPAPPTPSGKRGDGGGPSIAALRAQSDRVRREREPTLPKRPRGGR